MAKFIKNILATIWLIWPATIFWMFLSTLSPQMGLEEIGEAENNEDY